MGQVNDPSINFLAQESRKRPLKKAIFVAVQKIATTTSRHASSSSKPFQA
jgi:hypothetical protein